LAHVIRGLLLLLAQTAWQVEVSLQTALTQLLLAQRTQRRELFGRQDAADSQLS
jgi:hypothetical protein